MALLLLSFFTHKKHDFSLRWMFGLGSMFFLFSLSAQFYQYRASQASYDFPSEATSYIGEVLDFPQQKKRSVACQVHLIYPVDKKIMLYLEPDTNSKTLEPGDQLVVYASVVPFKNLGNPDDFDYERFMQNKGFSGSTYTNSNSWFRTGARSYSLRTEALRVRAKILDIYKSFGLDNDAYSFISAITLGYKADLTDQLKDAFRASGTSHVLAVSGLHVGIIYIIIISFFSFLGKRGKAVVVKQLLILLCLWGYVFITGMPVSVVRAAIMLSLLSIGNMLNRNGVNYNTLAVAAFFTLIINPFHLFDLGFQLSFASVSSILFFQPKISQLYVAKNKAIGYIWRLFTVSLSAQLGVFPLVLYYFGTFPTYFFITNLLVLPFIGVIIYSAVGLTFLTLLSSLNFGFIYLLIKIISTFIQFLINAVLKIVFFFESLPMSVIEGYYITTLQLFLIFATVMSFSYFMLHKHAKALISFLLSLTLLLSTNLVSYFKRPIDQFIVYNSYNESQMGYIISGEKIALLADSMQTIPHPSASIILLTDNVYKSKTSDFALPVDYLILKSNNNFSMTELIAFYEPRKVIIDSSISRYAAEKIQNECKKLNIAFHDISNSGAFSVNF
ncbi:MAG: ComEC family competence protein [Bacteroidales bacterium]|nr:ComEC family competence protein [Bacteroidales bacterium]